MNIEQAKEILKSIVDFYKLNDENNYDYSDDVLISMKLVLEEIERLKEDLEKEKYLVDKYTRQLTDEYKNTEYQCKEKERLNNIINEVYEYLDKKKDVPEWWDTDFMICMNILKGGTGNLKDILGSDKE